MNIVAMTLEELVRELPPELRSELKDYAEFLYTKYQIASKKERRLRQDWANALEDTKRNLSAVDLQHKALEWRGEE